MYVLKQVKAFVFVFVFFLLCISISERIPCNGVEFEQRKGFIFHIFHQKCSSRSVQCTVTINTDTQRYSLLDNQPDHDKSKCGDFAIKTVIYCCVEYQENSHSYPFGGTIKRKKDAICNELKFTERKKIFFYIPRPFYEISRFNETIESVGRKNSFLFSLAKATLLCVLNSRIC